MKKIVNSVIWLFVTIGMILCVLLYYSWHIRQRVHITATMARKSSNTDTELLAALQKNELYTEYSFWFILFAVCVAIVFLCVEGRYISLRFAQLRDRSNRLYKSSQSYKRLAQQAGPIMYTSTPEGYFSFVSSRVEEITGYTAEEVTDQHYSMFLDTRTFNRLENFYSEQMRGHQDYSSIQFEIITKSGERKWVEQLVSVVRDDFGHVTEFQCIVKDLYSSGGSDYNVDYIRERLEAVIDFTPSLMFIKDMSGRYLLVNKRFSEVLQTPREAIIGRIDEDLDFPWVERYAHMDSHVISAGTPIDQDDAFEFEGQTLFFNMTKFPLRNSYGEMIGICGIAHDVTDKKNSYREMARAKHLAEEARRAQEIFLANMSHEIRTPMNGILGMTGLLLQDPRLHGNQQEFITAIQTSAANLLVIINEILDFSKIKAGKLNLEEKPFYLGEEIENALYTLKHQAQEKDLVFITTLDEHLPEIIIGDKVRLIQVLVNLVENAIKFTGPGGSVNVHLYPASIGKEKIRLAIDVADTGIGIAPEKQLHIFESFTQSHGDDNRTFGGTGLGLAICRELAEMQQGSISVESKPGEGSRFHVEIPFNYDNTLATEMEKTPVFPKNSKPLLGKSILIVEDNLINQKVAYHALSNAGARVAIVDNGRTAVELVLMQSYDCILMDIQMPGMDGHEATQLMRKNGVTDVIIAMTASALKGEKERCLESGMNDYISKPFEADELFTKILKATGSPTLQEIPKTQVKHMSSYNIDFQYLRSKIGLEDHEINDLLVDMQADFPEKLEMLQQSVQSEDWQNAFIMAHQLKSCFSLLQHTEAVRLSLSIEMDTQSRENLSSVPHRVGKLVSMYQEILPALQTATS
ncbi:ATP-binding protein [Chitinophaga sp. Cy-1792]|uniref:ATP-binding protein n=1 Tax=Chitinophaga sp. Cy-1792 TaxID=2608339 RepID=UPI001421F272|nr:ATP-binding protein [Chitinophaga sp. Cy-1792]NIG52575.1 response regulator [Chitinophaga sp. Cy-1792]